MGALLHWFRNVVGRLRPPYFCNERPREDDARDAFHDGSETLRLASAPRIERQKEMIRSFKIKPGSKSKPNSLKDLQELQPEALIVLAHLARWSVNNGLGPITVTNIKNKFRESKSNTHPEGRAIDVSVRNWRIDDIEAARHYMEKAVGHLGAISAKDGQRRVFVYHKTPSGAPHIHLQVSR